MKRFCRSRNRGRGNLKSSRRPSAFLPSRRWRWWTRLPASMAPRRWQRLTSNISIRRKDRKSPRRNFIARDWNRSRRNTPANSPSWICSPWMKFSAAGKRRRRRTSSTAEHSIKFNKPIVKYHANTFGENQPRLANRARLGKASRRPAAGSSRRAGGKLNALPQQVAGTVRERRTNLSPAALRLFGAERRRRHHSHRHLCRDPRRRTGRRAGVEPLGDAAGAQPRNRQRLRAIPLPGLQSDGLRGQHATFAQREGFEPRILETIRRAGNPVARIGNLGARVRRHHHVA